MADNADAVIEICRHLDGIPLAIELAASRMQSMTLTEVRDRLDDRLRLLVGSRRGQERHQTLHHAVQWSYDLLDDGEQALLNQCSVFAGGFDLAAACAVAGSEDEFATLDLLDALVRKSLVVADRTSARTRFSMLETIRQFAQEQLLAAGSADAAHAAHARHFAGRETDILALWDSPQQREAYAWLNVELANLRSAFRWSAAHDDLDAAATIAVYAGFLGGWIELHEPSTWEEELVEAARAVGHPRLGQLYVGASECYRTGRLDDAVSYADAALATIESGRFDRMLFDIEPTALGGTYITKGLSDRWLELCRNRFARGRGINTFNRASMVVALVTAGYTEEAQAACDDLLAAADATDNPGARSSRSSRTDTRGAPAVRMPLTKRCAGAWKSLKAATTSVEGVAAAGEVLAEVVGGRIQPPVGQGGPTTSPSQVWLATTSTITSRPAACSAATIVRNSATSSPGTAAYPGCTASSARASSPSSSSSLREAAAAPGRTRTPAAVPRS